MIFVIKNDALAVGFLPTEAKREFKLDEELDTYVLKDNEKKDLEIIIDKLDGIILEGGLVSNQYEEEIAKICINKNIPILGICSGFNILIRALGGKVHIDSNLFHNQLELKLLMK